MTNVYLMKGVFITIKHYQMKNLFTIVFMSILLFSCTRDTNIEGNEIFIFGIYNGFCAQGCSDLFKIEGGKLFADNEDQILDFNSLKFQEEELSEDKYKLAKNAYDNLPQDLFDEDEANFGCPGCVDQDIVYLSYFDGADTWEWTLDTEENVLPRYLADYVHQLKDIVQDLK